MNEYYHVVNDECVLQQSTFCLINSNFLATRQKIRDSFCNIIRLYHLELSNYFVFLNKNTYFYNNKKQFDFLFVLF